MGIWVYCVWVYEYQYINVWVYEYTLVYVHECESEYMIEYVSM